jgi:hypothetical protein
MPNKFEGRWRWCNHCQCARIRCFKCGNISCSGGGCVECHDEFTEAIRMSGTGEHPSKEELLADTEGIRIDAEWGEKVWDAWSSTQSKKAASTRTDGAATATGE